MTNGQERINELLYKQAELSRQQEVLSEEINALGKEIQSLRPASDIAPEARSFAAHTISKKEPNPSQRKKMLSQEILTQMEQSSQGKSSGRFPKIPAVNFISDLEKFIGENLISKIGIAITVIGIAIGAKYTVDHDLISPLARIILGYLAGMGLLLFGIKLKDKFESYSAVLVSGAMATFYFITYAAYSYYQLFPQVMAFAMMAVFTAFTVFAALKYNRQVIAIIGLAGSYAVPYLLSDGSGNAGILFSYMAIINIGILVIAFKKNWKILNNVAFGLTWLIFLGWYFAAYDSTKDFTVAFGFACVFLLIFYASFVAYKLIYKEIFTKRDVVLILLNAFVFFGIGYGLLNDDNAGVDFLGLFTLANAGIHFIMATIIYRQKATDAGLLYLAAGLVLVFITLAIPVQLEGNWVTITWAAEAALLFWIGRSKRLDFYEKIAYVLMMLATLSLLQDWSDVYNGEYFLNRHKFTPLWNVHFLTSIIFITAFSLINVIHQKKKHITPERNPANLFSFMNLFMPFVLLLSVYFSFRHEIAHFWNQLIAASLSSGKDVDEYISLYEYEGRWLYLKQIWILNYTMAFVTILAVLNLWIFKIRKLGAIVLALQFITMIAFLTHGLFTLGELRESELLKDLGDSGVSFYNTGIRYWTYIFASILLFTCYKLQRSFQDVGLLKKGFDLFLYLIIVWVLSYELIHLLEWADFNQSDKLGLSILWGTYSLALIGLGIWKGKKHVRLMAIGLFGITLLKLFLYDLVHLNTMAKTIVFISLGILLLIISFLYNKYKSIITNEAKS